ncbi:MAG: class I SAM-dependent methyltransferase [Bacteroidota bacterium]
MKVHDSSSYKSARRDLIEYVLIPRKVLDVGCNIGETGALIKQIYGKDVIVHGIDYNESAIRASSIKLDIAQKVDLNQLKDFKSFLGNQTFDHILFGDVLEHLLYPIEIVEIAFEHLTSGGRILISLPNTGFYPSIFHLLTHRWPRNPRGIYDKTHLTIYTKNNLRELNPRGGEFKIVRRKYRWQEKSGSKLDFVLKILDYVPYLRNFFTFQFLLEIKKA